MWIGGIVSEKYHSLNEWISKSNDKNFLERNILNSKKIDI